MSCQSAALLQFHPESMYAPAARGRVNYNEIRNEVFCLLVSEVSVFQTIRSDDKLLWKATLLSKLEEAE